MREVIQEIFDGGDSIKEENSDGAVDLLLEATYTNIWITYVIAKAEDRTISNRFVHRIPAVSEEKN